VASFREFSGAGLTLLSKAFAKGNKKGGGVRW
jgi:hypothetical protein